MPRTCSELRFRRTAALPFVLLLLCSSSGCASFLSKAMVSAPNRFHPFGSKNLMSPAERKWRGVDQQFRIEVGPPEASLAVSIVEPKDFAQPRGTVLVLHGFWNESVWMLGTARVLSEEGYRAVLVDLRGHGASTGKLLTYGQREAQDLSQVIDELENRELIAGKLGVYGISYGATTSIHLAGRDPRIEVVVAVAPFSKMRDEVGEFGRTLLPGVGSLIPDQTVQQAVDQAGEHAGFDPDLSEAIKAIQRTDAPVLLLHGKDDWLVPPYHSLRLYEAGREHCELVLMPRLGHVSIWFDPRGDVAEKSIQWFARHLAANE